MAGTPEEEKEIAKRRTQKAPDPAHNTLPQSRPGSSNNDEPASKPSQLPSQQSLQDGVKPVHPSTNPKPTQLDPTANLGTTHALAHGGKASTGNLYAEQVRPGQSSLLGSTPASTTDTREEMMSHWKESSQIPSVPHAPQMPTAMGVDGKASSKAPSVPSAPQAPTVVRSDEETPSKISSDPNAPQVPTVGADEKASINVPSAPNTLHTGDEAEPTAAWWEEILEADSSDDETPANADIGLPDRAVRGELEHSYEYYYNSKSKLAELFGISGKDLNALALGQ